MISYNACFLTSSKLCVIFCYIVVIKYHYVVYCLYFLLMFVFDEMQMNIISLIMCATHNCFVAGWHSFKCQCITSQLSKDIH